MVSPEPGQTLAGHVVLKATAEDDGGVAGVRFAANGQWIGAEDTQAPYQVEWATSSSPNGWRSLYAVARDRQGNEARSGEVPVVIFNTGVLRIEIDVAGAGESPDTVDVVIDRWEAYPVPISWNVVADRQWGMLEVHEVPVGMHTVYLDGLPFQCGSGGTLEAQVKADEFTLVPISVTCLEAGAVRITVVPSGEGEAPDGIAIFIDGVERATVPGAGGEVDVPLTVGSHSVELGLLAFGCSGPDGPRTVEVTVGETALLEVPVHCAAFSSQRIAFAAEGPSGASDIFVARLDGSERVNLTSLDPDYSVEPSWSADGSRIAFTRWGNSWGDIWVMNADGSSATVLVADGRWNMLPRWSPDGGRILYTSDAVPVGWWDEHGRHRLVVMNSDGSGQQTITFGDDWYQDLPGGWSPDGSRILFQRYYLDGTDRSELYLVNPDGSDLTLISDGDGAGFSPAWSPDGTRIAFGLYRNSPCCASDIAIINVDGTGWNNVTRTFAVVEWDPAWTRDGNWLAYRADGRIVLSRTNGSDRMSLLPGVGWVGSFALSP